MTFLFLWRVRNENISGSAQKIGMAKAGIFVPWQTVVALDLATVFPADVLQTPQKIQLSRL